MVSYCFAWSSWILKKLILMWSVLANSTGNLLEYTCKLLPESVGGLISKKRFSWGTNLFGKTYGWLFYMGEPMIALCQEIRSFTNTFSSNLNTINPKIFPKHGGIRFIFDFSNVVSSSVSLMLTLSWGIDILFENLTPEIGGWIWKTHFAYSASGWWRFITKPVFYFNIFCGDLHFDASIMGLCLIYLIIGQTIGEGAK